MGIRCRNAILITRGHELTKIVPLSYLNGQTARRQDVDRSTVPSREWLTLQSCNTVGHGIHETIILSE